MLGIQKETLEEGLFILIFFFRGIESLKIQKLLFRYNVLIKNSQKLRLCLVHGKFEGNLRERKRRVEGEGKKK